MDTTKTSTPNKLGGFRLFFKKLFGLNQTMTKREMQILSVTQVVAFLLIWQFMFPFIIPKLDDIGRAFMKMLLEEGVTAELSSTIKMVARGMLYSIAIGFSISYLGEATNFFKPLSKVFPYFRFWSMFGFQPIIRIISVDGDTYKMWLLIFAAVPFMVTGFNTVLHNIRKDPLYNYSRTLGFPEWKCFVKVVIRSRLLGVYQTIKTCFAIAWLVSPTIEIAMRDNGGIGAMLFDKARFVPSTGGGSPYASAFALQFVILGCGIVIDLLFRLLFLTLPEERIKTKN